MIFSNFDVGSGVPWCMWGHVDGGITRFLVARRYVFVCLCEVGWGGGCEWLVKFQDFARGMGKLLRD